MFAWAKAGSGLSHVAQISAEELHATITKGDSKTIVDVRAPREYDASHIEGTVNIPVHELRSRHSELDKKMPSIIICNTGHRSSLGASLLKQRGFSNVSNVAGGMTGYNAAGFGPECPMCVIPHGPSFVGRKPA
jgi:rhodanese-related sulfurtransferase